MIRTLCLYWLLQCVRNGFFKVEVIGVSGCDLRVSQGDWRSLMLAPPRASFLRHGWLHHHFSICCPFVKTLSGLCNFGHSYWGAICQTAFQVETFKFSQVLATSICVARFSLHLPIKLWKTEFDTYVATVCWHLVVLQIYVCFMCLSSKTKRGRCTCLQGKCVLLFKRERRCANSCWSVWLLFSFKMGVVPTKITCKAPSKKNNAANSSSKGNKGTICCIFFSVKMSKKASYLDTWIFESTN